MCNPSAVSAMSSSSPPAEVVPLVGTLTDMHVQPSSCGAAIVRSVEVAPLPFELVVLEVALGDVCAELGRRARELEMQAHPAVEALTKDVRSWFYTPCRCCHLPCLVVPTMPLRTLRQGHCNMFRCTMGILTPVAHRRPGHIIHTFRQSVSSLCHDLTLCHASHTTDPQACRACR